MRKVYMTACLIFCVLWLPVLALAQRAHMGGERQPQPEARVQVTQTPTLAVCGDECDCGAATLVAKEHGPARCSRPPGVVRSVAGNVVCVPWPIPLRSVGTNVTVARRFFAH